VKTSLDRMIELWRGIEKLHFDVMMAGQSGAEITSNDRLRLRAQFVALALEHYKLELEK
jgi:hypothetical protein